MFLTAILYQSENNLKTIKTDVNKLNTEKIQLKETNKKLTKEISELKGKNSLLSSKASEDKAETNIENTPVVNSNNDSIKTAYLTFDDGPSPNTLTILNILKVNNIHAIFFVNGRPQYSSIYKEIINQGNEIGNHTYSHEYSEIYKSAADFNADVEKLNNFLFSLGISSPVFMRFPGGSNNTVSYNYGGKNIMNTLIVEESSKGYFYVDWNVDSGDADKITEPKQYILNKVISEAKGQNNIIVLLHDAPSKSTTAEVLPEIISYLKSQGYTFELLSKTSPLVHFK